MGMGYHEYSCPLHAERSAERHELYSGARDGALAENDFNNLPENQY